MDSWRGAEVPVLPGRGKEVRLRDTATGELVIAATGHRAALYACGITPYDATHMGHAATFTAWDLLVRAWLDAGHEVVYAQNVTDVDDPLLERAERDGEDWRELALRETERYRGDMEALRNLPPTYFIGAVEAIGIIDAFAERLAARGSLYDLDGDIYFARGADPAFGALSGPGTASGLSVEQMTELSAERGGDPGRPGKKDPLDPLVWRAERPGEPSWESRFGPGRPGWHVECAAIADRVPRPVLRRAGRRQRPGVPAPRDERLARAGGLRRGTGRARLRPGLRALRHGRLPGGEDVQVARQPGLRLAAACGRASTRWRSGWRCSRTTTGPTGSGPTRSSRRRRPASIAGGPPSRRPSPARPTAAEVLATVRARLADDLDAPGALDAIDAWADAALALAGTAGPGGDHGDAALIRGTADALLGVAL